MSDSWTAFLETPPTTLSETFAPVPQSSLSEPQLPAESYDGNRVPTAMESLDLQQIMYHEEHEFSTFGELENRVVICSNIPSTVSLDDFKATPMKFGDVEYFDTSQFDRGIVTVHYFDICSAHQLKHSDLRIDGKPIMMSFGPLEEVKNPKKPPNNGTIVIFHLPEDATDQELMRLFSKFGNIRQIRSSPFKQSQRFIEFYDKRHAQAALTAMNGTYVRNSKINIEFSLPGGFRRNPQNFAPAAPTVERVRHNH